MAPRTEGCFREQHDISTSEPPASQSRHQGEHIHKPRLFLFRSHAVCAMYMTTKYILAPRATSKAKMRSAVG